MFWRVVGFLGFLGAGALAGWETGHDPDRPTLALALALTGGFLWFALDSFRAARALRQLRANVVETSNFRGGLWGELLERAYRQFRIKDKALQEAQERLHDFLSALQASPNGVVLLDDRDGIEWCNQTAAVHFGLDPQRDVKQTIGNLVRDPGFVAFLAARTVGQELRMPGRGYAPGRPMRLSVQLHPYGQGRSLLLSRDVTALEQAEVMRRDFVANVSHEIRTPLTVLAGFVETLQTLDLSSDERDRYLALMATQSNRMQNLVNDLLTLSRLEGSPLPEFDQQAPCAELMQRLQDDARSLSAVVCGEAAPHQMQFDCTATVALVGHVTELISAMGNLVSNAVRYTPPGGCIAVSMKPGDVGSVVFEVRDTGPGIAPEHLPRLTERFYRVDRSRSCDTGGTGLGLAIVKHVAQRHNVQLTVDSTPGQGSVFRLIFPAVRTAGIALSDSPDD